MTRPEMPAQLADLPRWRGLPVPYINCWGDELDEHAWRRDFDPTVGREAWFTKAWVAGVGPADFTKQCLQRQRQVAMQELCQVCARPVGKAHWLILFGASIQKVEINGLAAGQAVTEPWVCFDCLPYVLHVCPGLRRFLAAGDLGLVEVDRWERIVSEGWHDDYGPKVSATMWVKLMPTAGQVYLLGRDR